MLTDVSQAIAADVRKGLADVVRGKITVNWLSPDEALNLLAFGIDESLTLYNRPYVRYLTLYLSVSEAVSDKVKAGYDPAWNVKDAEQHRRHVNGLAWMAWKVRCSRYAHQCEQVLPHEVSEDEQRRRLEMRNQRMKVWEETGYETPSIPTDWWYGIGV